MSADWKGNFMSAQRHATDANSEALRLHLAIQGLCERNALGENITPEDIGALLRSSVCVQYHTARTLYAVGQFGGIDRRDVAKVIPGLAQEVAA
jgi:hypothetical protein